MTRDIQIGESNGEKRSIPLWYSWTRRALAIAAGMEIIRQGYSARDAADIVLCDDVAIAELVEFERKLNRAD